MNVTAEDDHRVNVRSESAVPVTIYLMETPEKYYYGVIDNFSSKGMHIQTTDVIEDGTPVVIRLNSFKPDGKGPEAFEEYFGRIAWWSPNESAADEFRYGCGVEYDHAVKYS